jgi:hypothetical protein
MKKTCEAFGLGNPANLNAATAPLVNPPIRQELVLVARTFVELQEARHKADYDTLVSFSKADVITKI